MSHLHTCTNTRNNTILRCCPLLALTGLCHSKLRCAGGDSSHDGKASRSSARPHPDIMGANPGRFNQLSISTSPTPHTMRLPTSPYRCHTLGSFESSVPYGVKLLTRRSCSAHRSCCAPRHQSCFCISMSGLIAACHSTLMYTMARACVSTTEYECWYNVYEPAAVHMCLRLQVYEYSCEGLPDHNGAASNGSYTPWCPAVPLVRCRSGAGRWACAVSSLARAACLSQSQAAMVVTSTST